MTIEYSVDENDFINFQLYVASKSDRIRKKRENNKWIVPIIYGVIGILFLFKENLIIAISFFAFGMLWLFIYPIWERRHYVKHFQSFIRENYKERVRKPTTMEFGTDFLFARSGEMESKIPKKEIEEIIELPEMILMKLKTGQAFIFPKNKIKDLEEFRTMLKELAGHLNISYNIEESWEWK